jgi:DNA-binding response OmpR family regulator
MKMLLVEDELLIRQSVGEYLNSEGYLCETAPDFEEASRKLDLYEYEIVLIDITLPGGSGLNLIRQVKARKPETGIIIISARNSLDDKVAGLDLGADDYLTKPFHLAELNSRIKALMRRRLLHGSTRVAFGPLTAIPEKRVLLVNENLIDLTRKEFDLLLFLLTNPGRVLSRETIAEHLLGEHADLLQNFDFIYTHMNNIRRKLSEAGYLLPVKTVYGIGYKFVPHENPE